MKHLRGAEHRNCANSGRNIDRLVRKREEPQLAPVAFIPRFFEVEEHRELSLAVRSARVVVHRKAASKAFIHLHLDRVYSRYAHLRVGSLQSRNKSLGVGLMKCRNGRTSRQRVGLHHVPLPHQIQLMDAALAPNHARDHSSRAVPLHSQLVPGRNEQLKREQQLNVFSESTAVPQEAVVVRGRKNAEPAEAKMIPKPCEGNR
mmetsp:Transcript_14386/g.54277  ORF Transcript_14386/g.54277 Transcript_14386/m.54277 type:complete len:203 (+) Transcript_14386:477-1085(+)